MKTHVVMFSSGAASWAAARRVADKYGTENLYLVFSDVKGNNPSPHSGEDEDNYRFLYEAHANIGGQLIVLNEGRDIWQVFRDDKYIGNSRLANCSRLLKQKPARDWLNANCLPQDTIIYVGIDWTESDRLDSIERNYRPYEVDAPLLWPPYPFPSKPDIIQMLATHNIRPPRLYDLGFAHANCGGFCVRSGLAHLKNLYTKMPERYAYHEEQEQITREALGKPVTVYRQKGQPITMKQFREQLEAESDDTDPNDIGGCGCFIS